MNYFFYIIFYILTLSTSQSFAGPSSQNILFSSMLIPSDSSTNLTGSQIIDINDFNPDLLLIERNPELVAAGCSLRLDKEVSQEERLSQRFQLYCTELKATDFFIKVHKNLDKTVMITANLPPLKTELADINSLERDYKENRQLCLVGHELASCLIEYDTDENNHRFKKYIDERNQKIISKEDITFQLAHVYKNGPQDSNTIPVELNGLNSSGYLEAKNFKIKSQNSQAPTVYSQAHSFIFNPETQALKFDQVQAYYATEKALSWFQKKFAYQFHSKNITIFIHSTKEHNVNNAFYSAEGEAGPEINIGSGDGKLMQNLSRDNDVIAHEFSHHIIYKNVSSASGEAGIIHEGFADYFTYAMSENPNLGETIKVGSPYLRTALLDPAIRYNPKKGLYAKSQTLTAALWSMRSHMGTIMDDILYSSLDYLSKTSNLREAFIAILNSDRDFNPLEKDNAEYNIFGKYKCDILFAAIDRGFQNQLKDIDGLSCGLDINKIIADRTETDDRYEHGSIFSKIGLIKQGCSTIELRNRGPSSYILLLLYLLPIVVILFKKKKGHKNEI